LSLLGDMVQVNSKGGVQPAEAFTVHRDLLSRRADAIDSNVRARLERARNISAADYIDMVRQRAQLIRAMDGRMADLDVLAMPTTPLVAPTLLEVAGADDFCRPTYPSDASFCISLEVSSGPPETLPLKRRSKASSWPAIVSTVALEVCARLRLAPGSADRS